MIKWVILSWLLVLFTYVAARLMFESMTKQEKREWYLFNELPLRCIIVSNLYVITWVVAIIVSLITVITW